MNETHHLISSKNLQETADFRRQRKGGACGYSSPSGRSSEYLTDLPRVRAYRTREPEDTIFVCLHKLRLRWASRCDRCREHTCSWRGCCKPPTLLGCRWFGSA